MANEVVDTNILTLLNNSDVNSSTGSINLSSQKETVLVSATQYTITPSLKDMAQAEVVYEAFREVAKKDEELQSPVTLVKSPAGLSFGALENIYPVSSSTAIVNISPNNQFDTSRIRTLNIKNEKCIAEAQIIQQPSDELNKLILSYNPDSRSKNQLTTASQTLALSSAQGNISHLELKIIKRPEIEFLPSQTDLTVVKKAA